MTADVFAWPNQGARTFLAGRNVTELAILWGLHALLATAVLLPGTPLDALRATVAFLYLLLVPGLLLVCIFRLYQDDLLAQLVTAVGLSLIYIMFLGLGLSGIHSSFVERPLAAEVFVPVSLGITGALALGVPPGQSILAPFAPIAKFRYLGWALLPFAAIAVALHVQGGGSNLWMVVLLTIVAAAPMLMMVRRPTVAEFAVAIFSIAVALAFHKYFVAPEIRGWDIRIEMFVATQTLEAGRWAPQAGHLYEAMLSVTALPAVMSSVAALEMTTTFRILFGIILALIPVTLFLSFRNLLGFRWAFVAASLYLGHFVFLTNALGVTRQNVASFLVVLLLLAATTPNRSLTSIRVLQLALVLTYC